MSAYHFTHGDGNQYWIGLRSSLPPGGPPVAFADEGPALEFLRGVGYDSRVHFHTLNALLRLSPSSDPASVIARQIAQGTLGVAHVVVSGIPRGEAPTPEVKKAAPAALGFVRPEQNPRPTLVEPVPRYRHKYVIEIAGSRPRGAAGSLLIHPQQGEPQLLGLQQSGRDPHRIEVVAESLDAPPCDVSLALRSEEGLYLLPLRSAAAPVENSVQQEHWPDQLVPLMVLARSSRPALRPGKPHIKTLGAGWTMSFAPRRVAAHTSAEGKQWRADESPGTVKAPRSRGAQVVWRRASQVDATTSGAVPAGLLRTRPCASRFMQRCRRLRRLSRLISRLPWPQTPQRRGWLPLLQPRPGPPPP